ncbi:class I SAM-dependent methyltransferase [Methylophaga lonarensis]|uniref:class I SAM-dependent methyltransferase n=1 Tax=Methylophaga lonarensis TaxID=999151 RepID=UPI003D2963E8
MPLKPVAFCASLLTAMFLSTAVSAEHHDPAYWAEAEHRSEANKHRNQYRNPAETLAFFGISSDMTVIEVWPGRGWYTEILAPWLHHGGGRLIAAGWPAHMGPEWRLNFRAEYNQWLEDNQSLFGEVKVTELGPENHWSIAEPGSADAIVTFRNVHNWLAGDYAEKAFHAMFRALKPGGILGVVDHRAKAGTDLGTMKKSGYITEAKVVELAGLAGFVFEAGSEINANPMDSTDHPAGVWTLPPALRLGDEQREHYLQIGESDRLTLRFRKPIDADDREHCSCQEDPLSESP